MPKSENFGKNRRNLLDKRCSHTIMAPSGGSKRKFRTMKRHVLLALFFLLVACIGIEAYYIVVLQIRILEQETEISRFTAIKEKFRRYQGVLYAYLENEQDLSVVPRMYAAKGELDKALAWADLYVNLYGDGVPFSGEVALAVRGDIYYAMQNYQDAIKDYSSAIDLISGCSDSYYRRLFALYATKRGKAYKALGDTKKAVDDFCFAIRHMMNTNENSLEDAPPLLEDIYQYLETHQDLLPDDLTLQEIKSFRLKVINAKVRELSL